MSEFSVFLGCVLFYAFSFLCIIEGTDEFGLYSASFFRFESEPVMSVDTGLVHFFCS